MALSLDPPLLAALESLLPRLYPRPDLPRRVRHVVERPGPQGASGARVRYLRVVSVDPTGRLGADDLVVKPAAPLERRILRLLEAQGCAVPPLGWPDRDAHQRQGDRDADQRAPATDADQRRRDRDAGRRAPASGADQRQGDRDADPRVPPSGADQHWLDRHADQRQGDRAADQRADRRAPVAMPLLEARQPLDLGHPRSPLTHSVADGLAGIHAANLGRRPEWLRQVADDPHGRLWLRAWRQLWPAALSDPSFAAEFGAYTERLDRAMERFLAALAELTREGDALTLLNVDLLPDHIRLWRGRAVFVDWEQSAYGPLYLDLPNHFTVETALAYRDALAARGHPIPAAAFLERYRELGRYMGLRYLGAALEQWHAGGPSRADGRWFLHYTVTLALRGR